MLRKLLVPAIFLILVGLAVGYKLYYLPRTQVEDTERVWVRRWNKYTTVISYPFPGGDEVNKLVITLDKGVIKNVEVGVETKIDASIRYQERFAKEIPQILVGKKLAEVGPVDKVSGATLTTNAFNEALIRLKQQLGS